MFGSVARIANVRRGARRTAPGAGALPKLFVHFHEKLSFAVSIRLMNTSLESRIDLCPMIIAGHPWIDAGAQLRRVAAADVQGRAERDDLFHAGQSANFLRERREVCAGHFPRRQRSSFQNFVHGAGGKQIAVGDVGQPMTPFRLVHVMRGDEDGQAAGGKLMDLIPEFAARLGVNTRRRLIEQEQLRFVDQARGQREPLFPAAGKRAGELFAARHHAETFEAFFRRQRRVAESRKAAR